MAAIGAECGLVSAFPWSKQCRNAMLLLPADVSTLRPALATLAAAAARRCGAALDPGGAHA